MANKINHDGRLPPLVTDMPVSHTHDRSVEHAQHHAVASGLARTGGQPKKSAIGGPVPVNSGMHFRDRDGNLNVGITHQQVTNAPDASGRSPLDPTVPAKRLTPAAAHPSMRSRTADTLHSGSPGENHLRNAGNGVDHDNADDILREGFNAAAPDDRAAHGRG